jgi:sugar/nucleoside kinase (ribokinase family)
VDLQDVQGWDDPYDQDFLAGADVLLMSHERLSLPPHEHLAGLLPRTRAGLVVLGMGAEGSLAWRRGDREPVHTAAAALPAGTDTTGAGDTLLAGVVSYALGERPLAEAMRLATDATAAASARRHHGGAVRRCGVVLRRVT